MSEGKKPWTVVVDGDRRMEVDFFEDGYDIEFARSSEARMEADPEFQKLRAAHEGMPTSVLATHIYPSDRHHWAWWDKPGNPVKPLLEYLLWFLHKIKSK